MYEQGVRKIIHVDMDAFYASVEIRDNPSLRGQPVVVGGSPRSRGVVAAASYEARKFGIHSAMPSARAQRLCPQLMFLRPDFAKYRAVSEQIRKIFYRYTDLVEPLSLDEAYLDVTQNLVGNPSATRIAQEIRRSIRMETALTASAGVSINKFLAKIASDEHKPDGLMVIRPQDVPRFLEKLPLDKVPGVGRVTQQRFAKMQVHTCGELQRLSLAELELCFGKRGGYFYRLARGEDDRPVEPRRERKSISIEDTFAEDHHEEAWLLKKLKALVNALEARCRSQNIRGRTVTLKMRMADFRIRTRSITCSQSICEAKAIWPLAERLYRESGLRGQKLRLLGVGLSQLDSDSPRHDIRQLKLPF